MRCKVAAILFFSFVVYAGTPVFAQTGQARAQQNPPSTQEKPGPPGQVRAYLHPIRKFTAIVPAGDELSERGDSVQVSIRSRQGYIINIQTGDANPTLPLAKMITKLEMKYLGDGKPWSQKLGTQSSTMGGLDAIEALYEGAGTRVKVVVARGVKTDFVIIFFAPVESYEMLERKFNWFLSNFLPNPAEIPCLSGR